MRSFRLTGIGVLALASLVIGLRAEAQGPLRRMMMRNRESAARSIEASAPAALPEKAIAYGPDPMQSLGFRPAVGAHGPAPLIVFVHGGGWSRGTRQNGTGRWKEAHFPSEGYAFASIDYRLVPGATVEDEAADVAHALKALLDRAAALGIDPGRVVLMGHSAGAQLVALVGTDERYLKGAGLSFAQLAGVIPIDGAAYDVPAQMRDGPAIMQRTYSAAFGTDSTRQRALSPTVAAAAHPFASGHAPHFLLVHVQRPDGVRQAEALEAALKAAGAPVERAAFDGAGLIGHLTVNRRLGDPAYPATGAVDQWLKRLLGR